MLSCSGEVRIRSGGQGKVSPGKFGSAHLWLNFRMKLGDRHVHRWEMGRGGWDVEEGNLEGTNNELCPR